MQARRQIDPIARFMQEHNGTLVELSSLNKATKAIAENGFTQEAYKKVLRALVFIEEEVTVHNKSEEDALFPVLERYVEGPTQLMRDDHRVMKKEFRRLRRAVDRVKKAHDDEDAAAELNVVARSVVQLMVNHIHKENHILFPLVQKFLTKDALREVARRMM